MNDGLLTIEEAARMARISRSKMQKLTAARGIGFFRLGRRVYLHASDVAAYVASRRVEPLADKHND